VDGEIFAVRRLSRISAGLILIGLIISNPVVARAEEDILTGHSAAGQLKVDIEFIQPLGLPASVYPGISGYATGEMGLHSTILDDPTNDFFQLSPAGDFRFVLLAKDPGMEVWNDTGSGFMAVGESYYIGVAPFDTHPVWNIVTGTPGNSYSLTLKIYDTNGVYSDTAPFVLSFTPKVVPGPGPYEINIRQDDASHATLLWTTNAIGWTLESTSSLVAPAWNAITNQPDVAGTNFSLSIVTGNAQGFFRLHQQ
jgi:hypothetical protein